MKNKLARIGLLIGMTFSLFAFAEAQTASQFRVRIPFDFTVRGKAFRAGGYSINLGGLTQSRDTLTIRSADGKNAALLSVAPVQFDLNSSVPTLVFVLDEDGYALAELKTRRQSATVHRPKRAVRMAKNFKTVELVLK